MLRYHINSVYFSFMCNHLKWTKGGLKVGCMSMLDFVNWLDCKYWKEVFFVFLSSCSLLCSTLTHLVYFMQPFLVFFNILIICLSNKKKLHNPRKMSSLPHHFSLLSSVLIVTLNSIKSFLYLLQWILVTNKDSGEANSHGFMKVKETCHFKSGILELSSYRSACWNIIASYGGETKFLA